MILILGGTTEGRRAIEVVESAGKPYYYSTVSDLQQIEAPHALRLTGGMDQEQLHDFCLSKGIHLLIDAAHPFAVGLHQTVEQVARQLQLPVVRLERCYPKQDNRCIWCKDYEEAMRLLESDGVTHLLALTGVNTIARLKPYWSKHPCRFRILNRPSSLHLAATAGFPADQLLFFQEKEDEKELFSRLQPDAILTKESGESGYFDEKVAAALDLQIPVYVIRRPALPDTFHTVEGPEGLRKAIERYLPDFFPLHSGFTTGTCATAAAYAALYTWLTGEKISQSLIELPSGEQLPLPVEETTVHASNEISSTVIKEAGDDPDVTQGSRIVVTLKLFPGHCEGAPEVHFLKGEGVGEVTLPGLGLAIGEPAINKTPRQMIRKAFENLLSEHHRTGSLRRIEVTISVPGGAELAQKTFNPRLGIIGGISILGTSGIVRPFSNEAFIASIRKEASVAKAMGCRRLVINSGAKSERFLKNHLHKQEPDDPWIPQGFVHYGNFIGATLQIASELQFEEVIMGIMVGKAVKLAAGALDTHSKQVVMDKGFLQTMAQEAGCSPEHTAAIQRITLARELWTLLSPTEQERFFTLLLQKCRAHCTPLLTPSCRLRILLITEEGDIANFL